MDLQKQVTISPTEKRSSSPGNHIDKPKQLSLFEAVRMWTNDEEILFDIVDAGNRLTKAQIQEIVHSEAYKTKLLAFDERRRVLRTCMLADIVQRSFFLLRR
jgi:hypothetical protein